jgi:hypothetical protein
MTGIQTNDRDGKIENFFRMYHRSPRAVHCTNAESHRYSIPHSRLMPSDLEFFVGLGSWIPFGTLYLFFDFKLLLLLFLQMIPTVQGKKRKAGEPEAAAPAARDAGPTSSLPAAGAGNNASAAASAPPVSAASSSAAAASAPVAGAIEHEIKRLYEKKLKEVQAHLPSVRPSVYCACSCGGGPASTATACTPAPDLWL